MALATAVSFSPTEMWAVPLSSRRAVRVGVIGSVAALLLLFLWSGAPHVLDGPLATRTPSAPASGVSPAHRDSGVLQAERAGVDVDRAVEQASHTPLPVAGGAGALEVNDPAYRATFDHRGFSYAPTGTAGSFAVALSSVERGGSALPIRSGSWKAQHGAAVRDVSPGVSERVSARSGAVEWDVVLAARPAGRGDLRITAGLEGATGLPTKVQGDDGPAWRFALRGGGSVLLDELVVKDASGAVVHRALPEIKGGRVSLQVPAAVLDHAAYPMTLDPTVAGPYPVSSIGFNPAVAFDGTNYLVVWEQQFGGNGNILGARLKGNGDFISGPFLISSASNNESHADIAWNGNGYLVVWEFREFAPFDDYDINGQRLTASGGLDGANFVVYGPSSSNQRFDERHPSVASNNLDYFVTWDSNSNFSTLAWDVYGKTVSRNGAIGSAVRYAGTAKSETFPDVAWNGGTYLIVYTYAYSSTDDDIYGQQVNPYVGIVLSDGTLNGLAYGGNFAISGPSSEQFAPGVASEGALDLGCNSCQDPQTRGKPFLVAWGDNRNDSATPTSDVYGGRVGPLGASQVLDGTGFPIFTGPRSQTPGPKAVAFNGVYLVAWVDIGSTSPYPRGIYAARVNTSGTVLDTSGFTVVDTAAIEQSAAVSRGDGNQWGVAYENYPTSGGTQIQLRRVSPK